MADKHFVTPTGDPPDPDDSQPTPGEQWYLDCLRQWCRDTGRAPSVRELGTWMERTIGPTYKALSGLEAKGLVTRLKNNHNSRHFIPVEFAGVLR